MLDKLLAGIDPAAKRAVGDYLRQVAEQLTVQADLAEDAARVNERRRARNAEARRAAAAVDTMVLEGIEPRQAIEAIAGRLGLDAAQIAAWWHAGRSQPGLRRRARDIEIMRLVARGWTNAQLCERFQVSESTVTRIVRRALRRAAAPAAAARPAPAAEIAPPIAAAEPKVA